MSIQNFTNPDTLQFTGVRREVGVVEIDYTVTHPFPGPADLDGLPTAGNRADLGVAGRVLFLLDADPASGTFFAGDDPVVAETSQIVNADGFFEPKDLINDPGLQATAFPYKRIVDEAADNRTGISNSGSPTGNFDPTVGWQRDTLGPENNGWTGYGYWHQGQTAANTLQLDESVLAGGQNFVFDAVLQVKYVDPRSGLTSFEKRRNRLPANPADPTQFGYRGAQGALDVEAIEFLGESGGFEPNAASSSTLSFHIIDFDARATETSEADLGDDPVHVQRGNR